MFEKEIALGLAVFTDAALARIDLKQLDMRNMAKCVLGQLYGDYAEGLNHLRLSPLIAPQLGFCITPGPSVEQNILLHRVLTLEWAVAIIERRVSTVPANLPEASELADDMKALDEAMELDPEIGGATRTITRRRRLWEKPSR